MYHLLLADDDPNIRALVRFVMTREGYQVHEAQDGAEAVEVMQREPVNLAVMRTNQRQALTQAGEGMSCACSRARLRSKAKPPSWLLTMNGFFRYATGFCIWRTGVWRSVSSVVPPLRRPGVSCGGVHPLGTAMRLFESFPLLRSFYFIW
ncbi:ActR/RegA family two-component response regulator [Paenibacillus sp. BK720]|nr:ActR/RegA family two-component response regulator [Paenibacillus sp. BK720]